MDPRTKNFKNNNFSRRKPQRAARSPYTTEACQECRRRRSKCDGTKPSCGRCLRHGIECKFTGRDDSRGTAPKSLVMMLQSRIEVLEQVLWLHSIDVDVSIAQLRARGDYSSRVGTANHLQGPSSLPHVAGARSPQRFVEPDGALCSKESFGVEGDGEASYFGSSSGRVELLQSDALDTEDAEPISPPAVGPRLNQFCQAIESEPGISEEVKEHLIALYFRTEQPWCQLVDESLFRESMGNRGRYFSPLLLNSIFAIASRYSDQPDVRSLRDDPSTAGHTFLEIAEVLLHFDLQSPSITTIQSLGILAMMYVATGSDSKGWLRHGMAVRLALDMGLNLSSLSLHKSHALTEVEIQLRKQIYWALFCTDKMWASYTGRVCTMLDSQASVELPLPDTIMQDDPTNPKGPLLVLHHALSTHCQVLEKVLTSLYAPKRLPPGIQRHTFFDSCCLELKSWKYRLPAELQIRSPAASDAHAPRHTRPHVFILHMVYHTSVIMLTKPFMARTRYRPARATPSSTEERSLDSSQGRIDTTADRAATLCMESAREISLLGEQYRRAFGSFRHSPVTATHCTLSAVLYLIFRLNHCGERGSEDDGDSDGSETAPPQREIVKLISSCVVTLRELATSWTPARQYWRAVVAILKRRQVRVKADSSPNSTPSSLDGSAIAPDAYFEDSSGSFWDSVLGGGDYSGWFEDPAGMWPSTVNYDLLVGDDDFLRGGLMLDFPYSFEPFSAFPGEGYGS